jgi:hypothetical protein
MTIYWILKPSKEANNQVNAWIHENYPGIHYFGKLVAITPDWDNYRFPPHSSMCIWFDDWQDPEVNIMFKLANSNAILEQRLEEPPSI